MAISPGRDPEYFSPIWAPPHQCFHPFEHVRLQAGQFPPENPEQLSVFRMDCLMCGSYWDQTSTEDWVYEYLGRIIAEGKFGVVSPSGLDLAAPVEWRRQTRYGAIMEDLTGSDNPILSSTVNLKRPD
ncbi:hypothetical protein LZ318_11655 [Saccharopolyspora indica]|uniref:hypothetical protein n=1 Tax=Saccharopolyspora indica TaxID=1229659 RepID=UPI0022EAABAC|nr:hypothetical protein [Saccharopolyspora indica]MDA3643834.1 hypothetical protein [Saccharopolyspora indica]